MTVFPPIKAGASLRLLPGLILLLTLGMTWFVWDHESRSTRKELHAEFDFALRESVSC